MDETITFVGLDVSKKTIAVALAPGDPRSAVSYYGSIPYGRGGLAAALQEAVGGMGCGFTSATRRVPLAMACSVASGGLGSQFAR